MDDNDNIDFRPVDKILKEVEEHFKPEITEGKTNVSNITLYMDREIQELLRETARKENRSISRQVVHMIKYYLEHTKEK